MKSSIRITVFLVFIQVSFQDYHYCGCANSKQWIKAGPLQPAEASERVVELSSLKKPEETKKAGGPTQTIKGTGAAVEISSQNKAKAAKKAGEPPKTAKGSGSAAEINLEKKPEATNNKAKAGPSQTVKGNEKDVGNNSKKTAETTKAKDDSAQTAKGKKDKPKLKIVTDKAKLKDGAAEMIQLTEEDLDNVLREMHDELNKNSNYRKFMEKIGSEFQDATETLSEKLSGILERIGGSTSIDDVEKKVDSALQDFSNCIAKPNQNEKEKTDALEKLKDVFIYRAAKVKILFNQSNSDECSQC